LEPPARPVTRSSNRDYGDHRDVHGAHSRRSSFMTRQVRCLALSDERGTRSTLHRGQRRRPVRDAHVKVDSVQLRRPWASSRENCTHHGCTSGISLATAKRFVSEVAHVFTTGRREAELRAALKDIGTNVTGVQGDVSKLADLDRLIAQIQRDFARFWARVDEAHASGRERCLE
jgi:hypothetical protein